MVRRIHGFQDSVYQWAKFGRLPGLIHPSFNCIIGHVAIHSTGRDLESRVEKKFHTLHNRENAGNNLSRVILKLANIYIYMHIYTYSIYIIYANIYIYIQIYYKCSNKYLNKQIMNLDYVCQVRSVFVCRVFSTGNKSAALWQPAQPTTLMISCSATKN